MCVQEPKQFNEFLNHLHELCQEKKLSHFLEHFTSKKITLIPKSEAADRFVDRIFDLVIRGYWLNWLFLFGLLVFNSDVADEEAGEFTVKQEPKLES